MAAFNKKRKLVSLNFLKPAFSLWLVFLLVFQIIAGVLLFPPIEEADAAGENWYSTGGTWTCRKEIVIDKDKVSENLTDFPVLIKLSSDSDLASKAQSDFDDILFTSDDGETKLNHEIESYDNATGELVAWVKVPSLSSSADTVLYMYYNNSGASNQENVTGVWDDDYVGVWHMTEANATDSTSNGNNGTETGGVIYNSSGQIGGSLDFDGGDDKIDCGAGSIPTLSSAWSISCWAKHSEASTKDEAIIGFKDDATAESVFIGLDDPSDVYKIFSNGETSGSGNSVDTNWHYLVLKYDGSTLYLYEDTVFDYDVTPSGNDWQLSDKFWISKFNNRDDYGWDGTIDEARVSNTARSLRWISTEYNNQFSPSTFYNLGGEEALPSIQFTQADSSGAESLTPANLELALSAVSGANATVDYAITGGEATGGGEDYTLASGTAEITAGETTANIEVAITNDDLAETDETIEITISNPANAILGTNTIHTYTIQDNDTAGITVNPISGLATTEAGGEDSFTVVLNSQPAADVIIGLSSSDTTEGTVNPSSLIFTSANWNAPQTITVIGADDDIIDGDISYSIITAAAASSDSNYSGINPDDVSIINADNDTAQEEEEEEDQEYSSNDGKIYKNLKNTSSSSGKVSYSKEPSPNDLISLKVTPSFGEIEITIEVWQVSGDYYKKWKEDAFSSSIISEHIAGDLKANTSYQVFVDGELFGTYSSNSSGEISFTYDKGYSEKTFEVKEEIAGAETEGDSLAETGKRISLIFYLLSLFSAAIGAALHSRTIFKKNKIEN